MYYRDGKSGFPKDVLEAISFFEKDGSAEAIYEIAVIFRTDEDLADEDMYMEYLKKSANMGCEEAEIELAILMCDNVTQLNVKEFVNNLNNNICSDSGIGNFVCAYLLEATSLVENAEQAFDYYYDSACNSYAPALARLCCDNLEEKNVIRKNFLSSLEYGFTIAKYCIGCILFWGIGLSANKQRGLKVLTDAANLGNKMAARALYEIYNRDCDYQSDEMAAEWLKNIEKID